MVVRIIITYTCENIVMMSVFSKLLSKGNINQNYRVHILSLTLTEPGDVTLWCQPPPLFQLNTCISASDSNHSIKRENHSKLIFQKKAQSILSRTHFYKYNSLTSVWLQANTFCCVCPSAGVECIIKTLLSPKPDTLQETP